MSKKSHEIRGNSKARFLGRLAGTIANLFSRTFRMEITFRCEVPETGTPRILCLWHNRIIAAAATGRSWRAGREVVVLTSASKDGAILEAAMACFGFSAVRGSTSRRGAAAMVGLKNAIADGKVICVTPDGPRGPVYHLQPGLIKLASVTGVPIVPVIVTNESFWELETWDRFRIPKPFSKNKVIFGDEIMVPREIDDDDLEVHRKRVEEAMKEGFNGEGS